MERDREGKSIDGKIEASPRIPSQSTAELRTIRATRNCPEEKPIGSSQPPLDRSTIFRRIKPERDPKFEEKSRRDGRRVEEKGNKFLVF